MGMPKNLRLVEKWDRGIGSQGRTSKGKIKQVLRSLRKKDRKQGKKEATPLDLDR